MRYYVVCNWKMNPGSFDKARFLLKNYNKAFTPSRKENWIGKKIIVCPPSVFLQLFDEERGRAIHLGSQNIFFKKSGSYTGQISGSMLKDFGVEYVIVGHSEQRSLGDGESIINLQIEQAIKNSLVPVVCLGHKDFIKEIKSVINSFSGDEVGKMIFAYEPINAIGSGSPADPESVSLAFRKIRRIIYKRFRNKSILRFVGMGSRKNSVPRPALLYGGSINLSNHKKYLKIPDLSGFVIGGESLLPQNIKEIATNLGINENKKGI